MIIRRNANIDVDELERAIGTLHRRAKENSDDLVAIKYLCAFNTLDVLLNCKAKSFEDLVISIEARLFYKGLDEDGE